MNRGVVSGVILTLRSSVYLFLPAAASASLHRGAVFVTRPPAGCERTLQLRGEEVDLTEGLGDLQRGERVVPRRASRCLFHHPGNKGLTWCYLRGSTGERQRRLCCMNSFGPFCRVMLAPSAFIPDEGVVDVQVSQGLLGQYGVLNSFVIFTIVSGL